MTVGLPGTGIGAVFYILLAIYMPLFQLQRLAKGDNKARHWKIVFSALSLSAIILLSLYAEARLLIWCLGKPITFDVLKDVGITMGSAVAPAMAAMPFIVLFALVMGLHFIRLMLSVFGQKQTTTIQDCANTPELNIDMNLE